MLTTTIKLTEEIKPGDIIVNSIYYNPTINTKKSLPIVLSTTVHLKYRGSMIITVLEEGEIHEIETQLGEEFECLEKTI